MRKASLYLALLGLVGLGIPSAALASPTVTLKAKPVPIPKNLAQKHGPAWPHTGDILGAPAAVEAEFHINGKEYPTAAEYPGLPEYEYAPPPLRKVTFYLPKGTKINPKGFATCPVSNFERQDPEGCSKKSFASPPGEARGVVSFGTTHVHENVKVQAYFAPGGALTFYVEGRSPAAIETFASGRLKATGGAFSQVLSTSVPLIETVTGAPAASAEFIKVEVGAAVKKGKKLVSYGYMPNSCPKGGFPVKAELWFGAGASESSWAKSSATAKAPCPKTSAKAGGKGHHK